MGKVKWEVFSFSGKSEGEEEVNRDEMLTEIEQIRKQMPQSNNVFHLNGDITIDMAGVSMGKPFVCIGFYVNNPPSISKEISNGISAVAD